MNIQENIGGYIETDFWESDGNSLLSLFLQSKRTIKTKFNEGEKGINLDGYLELLKNSSTKDNKLKMIPIHKIEVQIKTISNYLNENKKRNISQYKYECDTKAFNVAKFNITENPIVLFLIDVKLEKIFWVHLSFELLTDLNLKYEQDKTIYFGDKNLLTSVDAFYTAMLNIFEENSNDITYYSLSKNETIELQRASDYLNNRMDTDFKFIKDELFSDVWKFGIAYQNNSNLANMLIYEIKMGTNDRPYRAFISDDLNEFNGDICLYGFSSKQPLNEIIDKFIHSLVVKYFFVKFINPQYLSTIVLEEIVFRFLDVFVGEVNGLDINSDSNQTVQQIKKYQKALYYLAYESISQDSEECDLLYADPINIVNWSRKKEVFNQLVNSSSEIEVKPIENVRWTNKYFHYTLFDLSIAELENRNIKSINRVWVPQNYSIDIKDEVFLDLHNNRKQRLAISRNDYLANQNKFFSEFGSCYEYTVKEMFPASYINYLLKKKYEIYCHLNSDNLKCIVFKIDSESFSYNTYDLSCEIQELVKEKKSHERHYSYCEEMLYEITDIEMPLYTCVALLTYTSICERLGVKVKRHESFKWFNRYALFDGIPI